MTLNKKQEKCIWIGLIIFILMGLFPPWVSMYETGNSITGDYAGVAVYSSSGYGFILSPPTRRPAWVDLTRLIPQWIMLTVLTMWVVYLKRDKKPAQDKNDTD